MTGEQLFDMFLKLFEQVKPIFLKVGGLVSGILAYFLPIAHLEVVLMACFIVDFAFGAYAGVYRKGEKFIVSKIWSETIFRMLITSVIIALLYGLDKEHGQGFIQTYNIANYFFCFVLVINISKNAYIITGWKMFSLFEIFLQNKVKDQTGINVNNEVNNTAGN